LLGGEKKKEFKDFNFDDKDIQSQFYALCQNKPTLLGCQTTDGNLCSTGLTDWLIGNYFIYF
jgi:hypothetical protein